MSNIDKYSNFLTNQTTNSSSVSDRAFISESLNNKTTVVISLQETDNGKEFIDYFSYSCDVQEENYSLTLTPNTKPTGDEKTNLTEPSTKRKLSKQADEIVDFAMCCGNKNEIQSFIL